jgi:hypothetical protein
MANKGFPRPGNNGFRRVRDDCYVEPPWAVHQFLDYLDSQGRPIVGEVLDPCCGYGTIVSVCLSRGIRARGSDIVDRGFGEVRDLLTITEEIDNVMANFPFSKAEEFVRHLMPLVRRRMLLILPLTWWESQGRHRGLHREMPMKHWYPCGDRPSMPPGVDTGIRDQFGATVQPDNKGGKGPYAWFEYERGFRGNATALIMDPRKEAA